jgi:hypothetical protein
MNTHSYDNKFNLHGQPGKRKNTGMGHSIYGHIEQSTLFSSDDYGGAPGMLVDGIIS